MMMTATMMPMTTSIVPAMVSCVWERCKTRANGSPPRASPFVLLVEELDQHGGERLVRNAVPLPGEAAVAA
jgi:hypothetical protein